MAGTLLLVELWKNFFVIYRMDTDQLLIDREMSHFRHISVFPNLEDITAETTAVLQENIVRGAYGSLEHYLSVHFCLLREDFVRPLREGISEVKAMARRNTKKRVQNVKVYQNVKIHNVKPVRSGILHSISFATSGFNHVSWRDSKRLNYGNLLCLSSDNFKEHVLFAVVEEREPKDLQQGFLVVRFVDENDSELTFQDEDEELSNILSSGTGTNKKTIDFDKTYTMVESGAFFEAYRFVLAKLKRINDLPLERYLIHCCTDMKPPAYLNEETRYNFGSVFPTLSIKILLKGI